MTSTDADKGKLVLEAFRIARAPPGGMLSAQDLVDSFHERGLNPDDIEAGLAYANLQGWIDYGPNQSAILTPDGHAALSND